MWSEAANNCGELTTPTLLEREGEAFGHFAHGVTVLCLGVGSRG